MGVQTVFKRYELKYLLTKEQHKELCEIMEGHMVLDDYGMATINNIYLDTDDCLLIRRSVEKPLYKEKIRIRGYNHINNDSKVFVELKKKYNHIVYKRRASVKYDEVMEYVTKHKPLKEKSQITKEIDYFVDHYESIKPKLWLSYQREAYYTDDDPNFRITFDQNILYRDYDLDITKEGYGESLLDEDKILMEVKTVLGMPKWLLEFFGKNKIYKTSFSKYGTVYKNYLLPKLMEGEKYAR